MKYFITTIFFLNIILTAFAQTDVIIEAADFQVDVGNEITYPITINPNGNNVGAFVLTIEYNNNLIQILDVEDSNDWLVISNLNTPGIIRVAGLNTKGQKMIFQPFNIVFEANGKADQTSKILLNVIDLVDINGQPLSFQYSKGSILINSITCGSNANTLLLLPFDDTLNGIDGETPLELPNVNFVAGKHSTALNVTNTNQLLNYSVENNLNTNKGTVEAWVKPTWNGNDGKTHTMLSYGSWGGLLIQKDGANNLRLIMNKWSPSGYPEIGVAKNISDWQANQWKHIAFTWGAGKLQLFINGSLAAKQTYTVPLAAINESKFQIGFLGDFGWDGAIDDLRISKVVRKPNEIKAFMNNCKAKKIKQQSDRIDTYSYPNPFNDYTTINFELANKKPVTLFVTDMMGKKVATLLNNEQQAKGSYTVSFNAEDYPPGMYYYTLKAGDDVKTQKMILVK